MATFYATGGTRGAYEATEFFQYLKNTYGDPAHAGKAARKLRKLKQGSNQYFVSFYPQFDQVLAECGGVNWVPAAKLLLLEGVLNDKLSAALVPVTMLSQYDEWVKAVMNVASRLLSELGEVLMKQGRHRPAEEMMRRLVKAHQNGNGDNNNKTFEAFDRLGQVLGTQGFYPEAKKWR